MPPRRAEAGTNDPFDEGSDAKLVARALAGDQRAFRLIIQRHEPVVAATVIGMLGRGAEADDVGQETFVRCFRSLAQFRGECALATWLVSIARNLSLTALTARARAERRFVSRDARRTDVGPAAHATASDAAAGIGGEAVAASDAALIGEQRLMVAQAVGQLSEAHRAVVVLRLLHGFSTRETAMALSIPEGTVLSRLARASAHLRASLGAYWSYGGSLMIP